MGAPKEEIRVLVCGSRDFGQFVEQTLLLRKALEQLVLKHLPAQYPDRDITLWHGDARGADTHVKNWAATFGIPCFGCTAPWGKWKTAAGPIRNQWMLKYGRPHLVVAFAGGKGTKDMVGRAAKAKIPVILVGGLTIPEFTKYMPDDPSADIVEDALTQCVVQSVGDD